MSHAADVVTTFSIPADSTNKGTFTAAELLSTVDDLTGYQGVHAYAYRFFTPSLTGTYAIGMTYASYDPVLILYSGISSFPASTPWSGAIGLNDDGRYDWGPGYTYAGLQVDPSASNNTPAHMPLLTNQSLLAGTNYLVAISSYLPTKWGGPSSIPLPADFFVVGPGSVTLGASGGGPSAWYWAAASGVGGTQTWSTGPSNTFWAPTSDGSGTKQTWTNGTPSYVANFGGTPGTVTVSGTVEANKLSFTTGGYTVAGGAGARVNFLGSAPAINLASGVSTTINADLGGSGPLAVTGTGSRGTLALGGNTTAGSGVQVTNALLSLSGTVGGNVSVAANAGLGGIGRITGTIGGAGAVAPGNSPGILTAAAVDPSSGLDFTFEFSGTAPNYASAGASVNDVLRLTGDTPFTSALTSANTKTLFLNFTKEQLALGTVLQGGFFTDADSDFLSLISNATWDNAGFQVYVLGDANGTDNSYNGQGYYNWRNPAMFGWTQSLFASTEVATGAFADGSSTGRILTLAVAVPEPATLLLVGCGAALLPVLMRRRRKRA